MIVSLSHKNGVNPPLIESSSSEETDFDYTQEEKRFHNQVLTRIHNKQKKDRIPGMPIFDFDKYQEMLSYLESPHIDNHNQQFLIAKFAGDKTSLLEERLKEVTYKIGSPIRNPSTGTWQYTIDSGSNFLGLLYRNFLDYIHYMMKGIGFIPRCAWCRRPINPTSQQLRRLKENKQIYCIKKEEYQEDCKRKGTTLKQNEQRNTRKME